MLHFKNTDKKISCNGIERNAFSVNSKLFIAIRSLSRQKCTSIPQMHKFPRYFVWLIIDIDYQIGMLYFYFVKSDIYIYIYIAGADPENFSRGVQPWRITVEVHKYEK